MPDNLRSIVSDVKQVRTKLARRIKIRIAVESDPRPVAPTDPFGAGVEPPDASTDIIKWASGSFQETSNKDTAGGIGRFTDRKGVIEMHPMFQSYCEQAYAFEIAREKGRWKKTGMLLDSAIRVIKIYVQGID